jgi:hypothetical protein
MGIVQNISRKQGRIFAYPDTSEANTRVFGPRGKPGASVVSAPTGMSDPTVSSGVRNVVSSHPYANPVGTMQNTSTQGYVPQLCQEGQVHVEPQGTIAEVGPHEHGTFFNAQIQKLQAQRVQGGVSKDSNTSFHPKKTPIFRQRRYPSKAGERTQADSFGSQNTLSGKSNHDKPGSRWANVKHGVVHDYVPDGVDGPSGILVGSGTTGTASTGSNNPVPDNPVASNAHQGSPYVVPWIPQQRSANQPNSKGNTFISKIGCKQGCK